MANKTLVTPYESPLITNRFSSVYLIGGMSSVNTFQVDVITQFGGVLGTFKDASDLIGSVRWYPFSLQGVMNSTTPSLIPLSTEHISLGGTQLDNADGFKIFDPASYTGGILPDNPAKSFKVLIGRFQISRTFNNFLDYLIKYRLYIPYFGFVDLDPKEVVGKWIFVYFNLDIYSGKASFYILKDSTGTETADAVYIGTGETDIGVDIPITLNNNATWALKMALSGLSALEGGLSKGGIAGVGANLPSTLGSLASNQQRVSYEPMSSTMVNKIITPQECFIEVTQPKYDTSYGGSDFANLYGLPSSTIQLLNVFKNQGYVKVAECHLEGEQFATATTREIEEIDNLLRGGVLL